MRARRFALALWGEDTHVDFERSLNFCVAKLRSALRDNAAEPRFIETLPTRGYRFIAPVLTPAAGAPGEGGVPDPPPAPASAPQASGLHRVWIVAAVSLVLAVTAVMSWPWRPAPAASTPKVVVVPFHNETGSAGSGSRREGGVRRDCGAARDARIACRGCGSSATPPTCDSVSAHPT